MSDEKIYEGDVGTIIDVDCGETITSATEQKLAVKKPDGTIVDWVATIQGTDTLRHVAVSGDLNVVGTYKIQPYLTLSGWTGRGKTVEITVYETYK